MKAKKKSLLLSGKIFYTLLTATGIILTMFPSHMVIGTSLVYKTEKHFLFRNLKAVNILKGTEWTEVHVHTGEQI